MKEEIKKIFKSFINIFQMLDDFGTEEDKDALLEMFNFAILGIVASEKDTSLKISAEFKSEPVPNSTGGPPRDPYTGEPWPVETFSNFSTDGHPIR